MQFNEMLISRAGVAGVPGSAFADSDLFDDHMRFCIAREDDVLQIALNKIRQGDFGIDVPGIRTSLMVKAQDQDRFAASEDMIDILQRLR